MNSNEEGKPEPIDPDVALRMIDLELMQRRAARQHASTPYRGLRAASLIFLITIVLGAALAVYYVLSQGSLDSFRAGNKPNPSPSLAPRSPSSP